MKLLTIEEYEDGLLMREKSFERQKSQLDSNTRPSCLALSIHLHR
jgi:hypothetical protein